MDGSPPGYSVHGILQGKIMEWVPISYSWGSSQSWNGTFVSCTSCIARQILYHWATGEARPCLGGFQKPVPAALLPQTPPCPKSKEPATPRYLIPKPLLHPRVVNWDCLVWRVDTNASEPQAGNSHPYQIGILPLPLHPVSGKLNLRFQVIFKIHLWDTMAGCWWKMSIHGKYCT